MTCTGSRRFWGLVLTLAASTMFMGCTDRNEVAAAHATVAGQIQSGRPIPTPGVTSKMEAEKIVKEYVSLALKDDRTALSKLVAQEVFADDKPVSDKDPLNAQDGPGFEMLYALRKRNLEVEFPRLILEAKMEIHEISERHVSDETAEFSVVLRSKVDPAISVRELFRLKKVRKNWKIVEIEKELAETSQLPSNNAL